VAHSSGRLLVIEDDRVQAEALALVLRYQGYDVDVAATANDGLTRASALPAPDLVLVDMGLPDLSGAEVVRRIRISSRVPIILLTAHRNVSDKITGLDAGADDYVTKPYEPAELLARIRAQFRRASDAAPGPTARAEGVRSIGGLVIDTAAHRVLRDGKTVALSAREFDVLRVLSEAPGRVVDRKTIFSRIWAPTSTAKKACWMSTSAACAPRSSPTPPCPRTCTPCAVSATDWSSSHLWMEPRRRKETLSIRQAPG